MLLEKISGNLVPGDTVTIKSSINDSPLCINKRLYLEEPITIHNGNTFVNKSTNPAKVLAESELDIEHAKENMVIDDDNAWVSSLDASVTETWIAYKSPTPKKITKIKITKSTREGE